MLDLIIKPTVEHTEINDWTFSDSRISQYDLAVYDERIVSDVIGLPRSERGLYWFAGWKFIQMKPAISEEESDASSRIGNLRDIAGEDCMSLLVNIAVWQR